LISKNIVVVFKEYMLTYDIDKKSVNFSDELSEAEIAGFDELVKKIDYFVQKDQSIILSMVGFPYKSSNTRDKVISSKIDAAEYYSLCYLQTFLGRIKEQYAPGATLYIFTDGIVFCDIENVPDEAVMQYENDLKLLSQDTPDIVIITTRDLCPGKRTEEIRDLISTLEPSIESFQQMIQYDKKLQNDIDVLAERMKFELALLSLSDEKAAMIGFQETYRSLQLSNFLKQFRPAQAIACSVHFQKNIGKKVGLKLSDSCVTPWHGVLVDNGDQQEPMIMHVKDVDMSAYQKAYKMVHGLGLVYFTLNISSKTVSPYQE